MSNNFFQFKQFRIEQDQCAQKVSEVACIQGAWTKLPDASCRVLDIGSGTGLLSLMLAQRNKVQIDAIELDEATYMQGKQNIEQSRFVDQITCYLGDVRKVAFNCNYDFIICNPPFYHNQLKASVDQRNLAKHSTQLTLDELIETIERLLLPSGAFSILLPLDRKASFDRQARQKDFHPNRILFIQHSDQHQAKYFTACYTRNKIEPCLTTLSVKKGDHYSDTMRELMEPYYL